MAISIQKRLADYWRAAPLQIMTDADITSIPVPILSLLITRLMATRSRITYRLF